MCYSKSLREYFKIYAKIQIYRYTRKYARILWRDFLKFARESAANVLGEFIHQKSCFICSITTGNKTWTPNIWWYCSERFLLPYTCCRSYWINEYKTNIEHIWWLRQPLKSVQMPSWITESIYSINNFKRSR